MRSTVILAVMSLAAGACGTAPSAAPGGQQTASPAATTHQTPAAQGSAGSTGAPALQLAFSLVASFGPADIPGLAVGGYISIGPDGNLYVPTASEVLVVAADGSIVRRWGSPGSGPGELDFVRDPADPTSAIGAVAFGPNGSVYVAEAGNKRVQVFDDRGQSTLTWGEPGTGDGAFLDPIGIAVAPGGEIFVVDDRRDDIQVFSSAGEYLRTIGQRGTGAGELRDTGNIRIRADGLLVNADFGNGRVQSWGPDDAFAWTLGSPGTLPGQFVEPQDVAFGSDGILFVVDDARVQAFDGGGAIVGRWPDGPAPEHLASLAYDGRTLWVLAPYGPTLHKLLVEAAP